MGEVQPGLVDRNANRNVGLDGGLEADRNAMEQGELCILMIDTRPKYSEEIVSRISLFSGRSQTSRSDAILSYNIGRNKLTFDDRLFASSSSPDWNSPGSG